MALRENNKIKSFWLDFISGFCFEIGPVVEKYLKVMATPILAIFDEIQGFSRKSQTTSNTEKRSNAIL